MIRYSKPLGELLTFKQHYFENNDDLLRHCEDIAAVYRAQPRRTACKNCTCPLDFSPAGTFTRFGVAYTLCARCGHCNGAYEDTAEFCRFLYTDDGGQGNARYTRYYTSDDARRYQDRVAKVYLPKARFLKEALAEAHADATALSDFGAGAGYFVAAARECGFDAAGYEPSEALVDLGNAMVGDDVLVSHDPGETVSMVARCQAPVASFIGVLEHLWDPRAVLRALSGNDHVEYVFFSVPLFSPTVVVESVFPQVMPRHLAAGHTHLYTEQSIQCFCDEFGFERVSEWWFGLDMLDLCRSVQITLEKSGSADGPLRDYWARTVMPMIDGLQRVLDQARACSEVHMLLRKRQS
jgi:hypothetical protein